jgi:hypothetical protein
MVASQSITSCRYYCTLTSFRVYGSTMLESFKEDMEASKQEVLFVIFLRRCY